MSRRAASRGTRPRVVDHETRAGDDQYESRQKHRVSHGHAGDENGGEAASARFLQAAIEEEERQRKEKQAQ